MIGAYSGKTGFQAKSSLNPGSNNSNGLQKNDREPIITGVYSGKTSFYSAKNSFSSDSSNSDSFPKPGGYSTGGYAGDISSNGSCGGYYTGKNAGNFSNDSFSLQSSPHPVTYSGTTGSVFGQPNSPLSIASSVSLHTMRSRGNNNNNNGEFNHPDYDHFSLHTDNSTSSKDTAYFRAKVNEFRNPPELNQTYDNKSSSQKSTSTNRSTDERVRGVFERANSTITESYTVHTDRNGDISIRDLYRNVSDTSSRRSSCLSKAKSTFSRAFSRFRPE